MPEDLRLSELEVAHTRELADRDTEIATLRGQLADAVVERVARTALTDAGCQAVELLVPVLTAQLRAERTNSQTVVRVVDDDGRPRVTLEGEFSVQHAALELKHGQYRQFFRPSR